MNYKILGFVLLVLFYIIYFGKMYAQSKKGIKTIVLMHDGLLVEGDHYNDEKLLKKADKYAMADDTRKDAIPYLFLSKANYEINKDWIAYHLKRDVWISKKFTKIFGKKREYGSKILKKHKDIAAALQKRVEEVTIRSLIQLKKKYKLNLNKPKLRKIYFFKYL